MALSNSRLKASNKKGNPNHDKKTGEFVSSGITIKKKHHKITEYTLTQEKFKELAPKLRGAGVHETLGPNWKDIYWSPMNRPYVLK